MKEIIYKKIIAALSPDQLEVIDQSHLHVGHAGAKEGGDTHFKLIIKDTKLNKMPRLEIHRLVNEALARELKEGVHAISIEVKPS